MDRIRMAVPTTAIICCNMIASYVDKYCKELLIDAFGAVINLAVKVNYYD